MLKECSFSPAITALHDQYDNYDSEEVSEQRVKIPLPIKSKSHSNSIYSTNNTVTSVSTSSSIARSVSTGRSRSSLQGNNRNNRTRSSSANRLKSSYSLNHNNPKQNTYEGLEFISKTLSEEDVTFVNNSLNNYYNDLKNGHNQSKSLNHNKDMEDFIQRDVESDNMSSAYELEPNTYF